MPVSVPHYCIPDSVAVFFFRVSDATANHSQSNSLLFFHGLFTDASDVFACQVQCCPCPSFCESPCCSSDAFTVCTCRGTLSCYCLLESVLRLTFFRSDLGMVLPIASLWNVVRLLRAFHPFARLRSLRAAHPSGAPSFHGPFGPCVPSGACTYRTACGLYTPSGVVPSGLLTVQLCVWLP
jgi:hypothetical protein